MLVILPRTNWQKLETRKLALFFKPLISYPEPHHLKNVALPLVYAGYSKEDREAKAYAVLAGVGLGERAYHKPNELSGGQRQRVAIARALVNDPSIILADEPTGNLDSKTSYSIMGLFEKLHAEGNTIVMVTHEDDISRYAHRIVRLRDGIVESDEKNKEIITAELNL